MKIPKEKQAAFKKWAEETFRDNATAALFYQAALSSVWSFAYVSENLEVKNVPEMPFGGDPDWGSICELAFWQLFAKKWKRPTGLNPFVYLEEREEQARKELAKRGITIPREMSIAEAAARAGLEGWPPTPAMLAERWTKAVAAARKELEIEKRYEYYQNVGWVDWSHANEDAAERIVGDMKNALNPLALNRRPGFNDAEFITRNPNHLLYPFKHYTVSKDLPKEKFWPVALGIFMNYQIYFEQWQLNTRNLPVIGHGHNSGFSQEDLPSDLIGFYIYKAQTEGQLPKDATRETKAKFFGFGKKLPLEEAAVLYASLGGDLGLVKNRTFQPLDYNAQTKSLKNKPLKWPAQLSSIQPAKKGDHWDTD
jgi:hypothetical protein